MSPFDVILLKIAEESAEVTENVSRLTKQVMKSARFGLDSVYGNLSNRDRLVVEYQAVEQELFDLRVALLLYSRYSDLAGESCPGEAETFGLKTFQATEYPRVAARLARYLETLDTTMIRLNLTWADAEACISMIRDLIAQLLYTVPTLPKEKYA